MQAVIYRRYGGPEVLELSERPRPVPADDEVLIRVHAAEVTKGDCELRAFRFPVTWFWLPLRLVIGVFRPRRPVLGGYLTGEVVETGEKVDRFSVGDEVYGSCGLRLGAHAEYAVLPQSATLARKPRNMSYAETAGVPLGGLNALHFMRKAEIQAGDAVLVNGAGGSIGAHVVQIARSMGARVTAVDNPRKEQMLRELGVERFIDYTRESFSARPERYDVVFSVVAGASYGECLGVLRPGGRYVLANPRLRDMLRASLTRAPEGKQAIFAFAGETVDELNDLREMIEAGKIVPIVDRVLPLPRIAEAHRLVEAEDRAGAIVVVPGQQ
ncbi:NADPH:quinone oxidoreductase [Acidobacteria bacterium Mor1]|nr:NADPH:quinone oxidoreductase [Acidobacteria bacterium Mor1]